MLEKMSFFRKLSQIGTRLYLAVFTTEVGSDSLGNRYFRSRSARPGGHERRFVLYSGLPEASAIPPKWYNWIHHASRDPLPETSPFHQPWEKEHQINPTGTEAAWRPRPVALRQGGKDSLAARFWSPAGKTTETTR